MTQAGKALKRVLKIYGITQNRLAVVMGVNRSSVFGWVNEIADPPGDTVVKIRKALQEIEPAAALEFVRLFWGDLEDEE
ncbi:helix-turn-helix transcriptional regulator [Nostoc sp. CENA67]|uniref:Helix-turn-helix transcriptional regulator n=1 Tax=Amazonocrinis nigriterrae CENA67 TaxID=2794033 RepID=A0A8J7HNX8_9NOST|nr:helix-turn-helix transcriptional regulator [Amazonocrinis nigriterrae]MBH8562942.1 helix-turn-helix transcriptional regulator [Amazonocrinis nigriterrae CENA67]